MVIEKLSQKVLGVIKIQDATTVDWLVREGNETVHAFDRCEGFRVRYDESKSIYKASLEKVISLDPNSTKNISIASKEQKSGEIKQKSQMELDSNYKSAGVNFFLYDSSILKRVYNYFAPRVIMKQFHDHYKAQKKLGKGSFASVYQVTHRETGKQLAIKAFVKEKLMEEDKGMDALFNEINLMKQINHRHLLKLYEVWESNHSFYFVIELANGGSLMDRINLAKKSKKRAIADPSQKDIDQITDVERKSILKQLLLGLQQLRERKILHRDIKPDNILLRKVPVVTGKNIQKSSSSSATSANANFNQVQSGLQKLSTLIIPSQAQKKTYKYEAVIIDFGLGTFRDEKQYLFPKCGTPGYVAPEVMNLKGDLTRVHYSTQCDVFSVGAVFYYLLTLKPLFQGANTKDTIELNKKCDINYNIPELQQADPDALDLLRKMLDRDPVKRIEPKGALKHQYFDSVNLEFEEELNVPDDSPTNIQNSISQFTKGAFELNRINPLPNSSMKSSLSDSTGLPSPNLYLVSQPNSPDVIRANSINEEMASSNQKGSITTQIDVDGMLNSSSMVGGFVNKNGNIYCGINSRTMISQVSIQEIDRLRSNSYDTSINNVTSEVFQSQMSLKMKAHSKNLNRNPSLLEEDLNNNLRSPKNNPVVEGRMKSPSKFKVDFDKTKEGPQFKDWNTFEDAFKEFEGTNNKNNNNLSILSHMQMKESKNTKQNTPDFEQNQKNA